MVSLLSLYHNLNTMIRKKTASQAYKFRIGSNIRKWRNIKEIKQKELANSLKLSEASVSNIENDITNITLAQLEEISVALNVSIEQLLSDPQEKISNRYPGSDISGTMTPVRHLENELLKAMIASMEKKDLQLQEIMQHFIQTLKTLVPGNNQYTLQPGNPSHLLNDSGPVW